MDHAEATIKLLDTAEELFYAEGVHTVGMDAIRTHSGVSLKRLYQCFPSKESLVEAYLTLGLLDEAKKNGAVLGYNFPGDGWYSPIGKARK